MYQLIISIIVLIVSLFPINCSAELTTLEQDHLLQLAQFCMLEIPGQKQKDVETFKRIIFGTESERKQLVDDFRRNVLIPQAQSAISYGNQVKDKATTDLQQLQDLVK
jgi:hypothetical protein